MLSEKKQREMVDIMEEILKIISMKNISFWVETISFWKEEIYKSPDKIVREIIHSSMGQGSLMDFPLYENGALLKKETRQLDILRQELFNLCVEALPEISKNPEKEKS